MAQIDKLLKLLNSDKNIVDSLDEEEIHEVVEDIILGYKIDDDSRAEWLETNKKAIEMIKNQDMNGNNLDKNFPFEGASTVVFPLIGDAVIQLSSRLIQHIVRNDRVAECAVMGDDPQGIKQGKADRVSKFLSYECLIESDSWLPDEHKICSMVASWGTAFKRIYYDKVTKDVCSDIISPEDVVINNSATCLDKCRRITIRNYMSTNELIEKMRSKEFVELDLDCLSTPTTDNESQQNDSREIDPVHEILEQFCYLDLDDDGYEEPYIVFVHHKAQKLLGIYPAFEVQDIQIDSKGQVLKIKPRIYIVDYHLIDDPEGKFYSIGLNQLLYHQNKSITSILRQLIDAGTLSNAASCSGFVTTAFKTKEREIKIQLGKFQSIEANPNIDLSKQIMNLPFKEPSQVLLALLQMLIESGKQTGFISDMLVGDADMQNVPATTMLAMVEQGTRAFKPVIQKQYSSRKKEFKMWFHLHSLYLDQVKYFKFNDVSQQITADDFDEASLDICPVADPTMSSEAHKYAKLQAIMQMLATPAAQVLDLRAVVMKFFTELEFDNVQQMIAQPQPPQPDPSTVMELQLKQQLGQMEFQNESLKRQLEAEKILVDRMKVEEKAGMLAVKSRESQARVAKVIVDAHKDAVATHNQTRMVDIQQQEADTNARKVDVMKQQPKKTDNV